MERETKILGLVRRVRRSEESGALNPNSSLGQRRALRMGVGWMWEGWRLLSGGLFRVENSEHTTDGRAVPRHVAHRSTFGYQQQRQVAA
jgi:hypothetical protein